MGRTTTKRIGSRGAPSPAGAEQRLIELGIDPFERTIPIATSRSDSLAVLIAASLWLLLVPGAMAQASAEPARLHWTVPPVLPAGALIAVVSGDPTGPGESTLQLSMPNGYRIPPHSHPSYEHVEVREGTLLVGMGDRLDPKQTRTLAVGDSATARRGCTISRSPRGGPCCP